MLSACVVALESKSYDSVLTMRFTQAHRTAKIQVSQLCEKIKVKERILVHATFKKPSYIK